jgi:trk system potassium uptake protein TrkA
MNVLIAGGGPTGAQLAVSLLAQKYAVCVIENQPEVLARLHHLLPTEAIYEGNPLQLAALEGAGVRQAHVLVACTHRDEENLLLCTLAHRLYKVGRTIARVNDPSHAWLFDEKFAVDAALNESSILAHLIEEEMSLGDMMTLLKLRRGQYSLVEVRVPEEAKAAGQTIKKLQLPENCLIAGIIRKNEMILPGGSTVIEAGDEILAFTDPPAAEKLRDLFSLPELEDVA